MDKKRQQELIEKMKYITVLDFEVSRIFQYKSKNFKTSDEYEQVIIDSGHNLSNCQWMIHDNGDIINKTGDLPF